VSVIEGHNKEILMASQQEKLKKNMFKREIGTFVIYSHVNKRTPASPSRKTTV
jgi:hypothetical protein